MARKSRMSVLKRERELKKSEKAARKRARRHGVVLGVVAEPRARSSFALEPAAEGVEEEPTTDAGEGSEP